MRALLRGTLTSAAAIIVALLCASYVRADSIASYDASLSVRADRTVGVTETIAYDFGTEQRHGIYRDVPIVFQDKLGATEKVTISDITVNDEKGNEYRFATTYDAQSLRIRIGDPDVLVTGKHTYVISYTAHDVIGFFDDHDELYWNVTGNGWDAPIAKVTATVAVPAQPSAYACYQGVFGSTEHCPHATSTVVAGNRVVTFATSPLAAKEGLTVAVGFQKGVIMPPSSAEQAQNFLTYNGLTVLPFIVGVILFLLWKKFGKDAHGRGTVIPEYDAPPDISPLLASAIVHESVRTSDLSAEIIRLATLGYLKIERIETKTLGIFSSVDYNFSKTKDAGQDMTDEERDLFNAIFAGRESVLMSDMKSDKTLINAYRAISKRGNARLVKEGYYRMSPMGIRAVYIAVGVFVAIMPFFVFAGGAISPLSLAGIVVTGIVIVIFGFIMPAKTQKGALAKEAILGLKEYLQIAEKNRLDFHNAPEKSPALFEKLLPYAIVLGVSAAWAKEFEGVYREPPAWYSGGAYPVFSPTAFENDIASFATATAGIATPTSGGGGAGGGGSVGGGFGGGGGGSW